MGMGDTVLPLNSSKLGTKEYWDKFYQLEQQNFAENSDDEGEIWFDDADAEDKIIDFLIENTSSDDSTNELPLSLKSTSVIDLGTGNGHLVFRVRSEVGFRARLKGVDYVQSSVDFARQILNKKIIDGDVEDPDSNIEFEQLDFLNLPENSENQGWDLVLDKGTLDAIALNIELIRNGKSGVQLYPEAIRDKIVKLGGIVFITSCNFTEDELRKIMDIDGFEVWKTVKYPVFEFGGVKGQSISSIAFRRTK
ncbi:methyltransferase domain-containing protein [Lipomyces japonicus]|uniref:methyltransferase domain-containing protein n=1 Tax=Lipomyces japonicus TaxID=56871 RepID=UPI0034CEA6C7